MVRIVLRKVFKIRKLFTQLFSSCNAEGGNWQPAIEILFPLRQGLVPGINLGSQFLVYILITLFAVLVNAIMKLTLAYPLTVRQLPGRNIYRILLLAILALGTNTLAEYVLYRGLGMVGTFLPYVITGFFSILPVFALKEIFMSKYGRLKEEQSASGRSEASQFFTLFLPKVWKPLLGIAVLQFATLWNSYFTSMIYQINPQQYSPSLLFVQSMMMLRRTGAEAAKFADPAMLKFGLLVSLPPIFLFLVCRKFLTSEVFTSKMR